MSNVRTIGPHGVTPRMIIDTLNECCDDIEELYVVSVHKGMHPAVRVSGTIQGCAFAGALLTDFSIRPAEDSICATKGR